jgi:hypothetical protein
MAYGILKVDTITFTDAGVDKSVTISGLVQNPTFSGNITVTGTVSGNTIQGQTVSGVTVTGTTANFASGVFTTQISGATVTGNVGSFTTITGGTVTLTSGVFALGSASNPSISFTGDANCGLYSPGGDQVAISTGGSGRLFVDASGRVGVAAASPINTLEVQGGPTANLFAVKASSGGDCLAVTARSAGGGGIVSALNNDQGDYAPLELNSDFIYFRTRTGVGTVAERLRITSAGLVGVGTSAPNYQLHVTTDFAVGASGFNQQLTFSNDTIQSLLLGTGYTALKLNPLGGNVGVGTTSPSNVYRTTINGDGSSIVGGLSLRNNGTETLTIGNVTAANDVDTEIWNPRNGYLRFATNNTERLRIDSSGRVGIGTSSPEGRLHVISPSSADGEIIQRWGYTANTQNLYNLTLKTGVSAGVVKYNFSMLNDGTSYDNVLVLDRGRVGIGTTSPATTLNVQASAGEMIRATVSSNTGLYANIGADGNGGWFGSNADLRLLPSGTERARIDSSGRLLVGTSSALSGPYWSNLANLQVAGSYGVGHFATFVDSTSGAGLVFQKSRNASVGGNTIVSNNDLLMDISIEGNDGTGFKQAAVIQCQVDGTPGANDMPGRLVFSTTADGASSPTERMRITSGGSVLIGKTVDNNTSAGLNFANSGFFSAVRVGGPPSYINRLVDDGVLVEFAQDSTIEGTISVSGTTVSYNGAHLSRWSQLPSGAERTEILRGSVLSNIDEMCEWGDEDNEQLNRMKVSDVEGDKNVSGVFQAWDDDDDTYTNDFYCAMTGDFIIRIAQGVTVERGDLLMSAGDGTAKPQDDDIIRSKTIAKVTSTNVSCTYPDGSYCVPCVLMAC